jgi:hypothetical protein
LKASIASDNPCGVPVQCGQHVRVQIGDPLFAFLGDAKVAQGALDVRAHGIPVQFRGALAQVTRCLISELLIEADLLELIEEGRAPQGAIRISELSDHFF